MPLSADVKRACLLCPFEVLLVEGNTTCPLIYNKTWQVTPSSEENHVIAAIPVDNSALPEIVSVLVRLREGFSFESCPQVSLPIAVSSLTSPNTSIEWSHSGAIDISHSIMIVNLQPRTDCDDICTIFVTFNLASGQPHFAGYDNILQHVEDDMARLHSDIPFANAITTPIANISPSFTHTILEKRLALLLSASIIQEKQLSEQCMNNICMWFYETLQHEKNRWSEELLEMLRHICSMHHLAALMPYFEPSHKDETMIYTDDTDVQRIVDVLGKEYIHPYGWYYNITWSPHVLIDKLKFADGRHVTGTTISVGDRVTYKDKDVVEIVKIFHGTLDENNNPTVEVKIVRKTPHAKLQPCE